VLDCEKLVEDPADPVHLPFLAVTANSVQSRLISLERNV